MIGTEDDLAAAPDAAALIVWIYAHTAPEEFSVSFAFVGGVCALSAPTPEGEAWDVWSLIAAKCLESWPDTLAAPLLSRWPHLREAPVPSEWPDLAGAASAAPASSPATTADAVEDLLAAHEAMLLRIEMLEAKAGGVVHVC